MKTSAQKVTLLVFLFLLSIRECKAFDIKLLGGYVHPAALVTGTGMLGGSSGLSMGFGVLFEANIARNLSVEFGSLYSPRGFLIAESTAITQFKTQTFQFPLMLRYSWLGFISLGAGAYFSHGLAADLNPLPAEAGSMSLDDSGLIGGLQVKIRTLIPSLSFIGDVRYLYGLQNLSQYPSFSVNIRDIQIFCGLQLGK